jgi:hypothetical protein
MIALILMGLALLLLFLSLPDDQVPVPAEGSATSYSVEKSHPVDLIETKYRAQQEAHQITIEHERLTSQTPRVGPVYQRPLDDGIELDGETIVLDELDPSEPVDSRSPRHEILLHLKEMQEMRQWRIDRNEAFVREVLRRAREDGWIVKLDENLRVIDVKRVKPGPYRESMGGAAQ